MSRARELLAAAVARGIFLYVEDGVLKYRAAEGLPAELRRDLRANRAVIVEYLERVRAATAGNADAELPPLKKSAMRDRVPLSRAQARMWYIDRLGQGSVQYHIRATYRLTGPLDEGALRKALAAVVARHESLRTVIVEENGVPYQVVRTDYDVPLKVTELGELSRAEGEAHIQGVIEANSRPPFDLSRDLMLRVELFRLSPVECAVLFETHHIATDAWSQGILARELEVLYAAYCDGATETVLPSVDIQYGDYASWQEEWLQDPAIVRQVEFWRETLQGAPQLHGIPADRERAEKDGQEGGAVQIRLGAERRRHIRAICRDHDVTLFVLLQTAVAVLIGRYSGDDDIVMGSPVSGRTHSELERAIGLFINTLVLRTDLRGEPRFCDVLARNKTYLMTALRHQHVPFELVVETLRPVRSSRYSPVFQILFNMQPEDPRELALRDLQVERISSGSRTSKFDLTFDATERPEDIWITVGYDAAIFSRRTVQRMAANLAVLLDSIIADPLGGIHDLRCMGPDEELRLRKTFNDKRESPVFIMDEAGRLLPEGARGRLFVAGNGDNPRPTGEVARWLSDGEVEVLGLVDDHDEVGAVSTHGQPHGRAPETATERKISEVWQSVLPEAPPDVGLSFFAAGGHSLSMIVLIRRVSKEFGVDIPLATFVEQPTIEATARIVDGARSPAAIERSTAHREGSTGSDLVGPAELRPLSDEDRRRPLPLSLVQERMLSTSGDHGGIRYNIPGALRIRGRLCRESLRRALGSIVDRHAVLRTTYMHEDEVPRQVINAATPFELPIVDLSCSSQADRERHLRRHIQYDAKKAFDLTAEPPMRASLLVLAEDEHALLFNMHHVATDGWSYRVLKRELRAFYSRFKDGYEVELPELPVQYCDYAVWQRRAVAAGAYTEDLEYWLARLRGIPQTHGLPLDRHRPVEPSYSGGLHTTRVSARETEQLERLGRSVEGTLFSTLHALLALLVCTYSGRSEVVVGVPLANRLQGAVEPLIGCFMNNLVLRTQLCANCSIREFLASSTDTTMEAFAHQRVPYELVARHLSTSCGPHSSAPFQIIFSLDSRGDEPFELSGAGVEAIGTGYGSSKADLMLLARRGSRGVRIHWEYATDVFDQSTIEELATAYASLLRSAIHEPEVPIDAAHRGRRR